VLRVEVAVELGDLDGRRAVQDRVPLLVEEVAAVLPEEHLEEPPGDPRLRPRDPVLVTLGQRLGGGQELGHVGRRLGAVARPEPGGPKSVLFR